MISVFTPTYNRLETIKRLYDSLLKQTSMDFEWIVVDDGSVDDTEIYLQSLIVDSPFKIIYQKQVNSGKHIAINLGSKLSNREWFFIVDSDDFLLENAIHWLNKKINVLDDDYVGVCVRRGNLEGGVIGRAIEYCPDEIDLTPTQAGSYFRGDLAYVFRTNSILRNQFPFFTGEKFVPELLIWNRISKEGKIKYFPRYICYLCEYLPDGYSKNFKINLMSNPRGFSLFYFNQFFSERNFFLKCKCVIRFMQCVWYRLIK